MVLWIFHVCYHLRVKILPFISPVINFLTYWI